MKAQRKDRGTRFGSLKGQRSGRGCAHSRAWQRGWPLFCEQPQMVGTVCSGGRGGLTCTEGVLKTGKAARPGAGRARGTGTNVGAGWQGQWGLRKRKQMDNTPRPHCLLHTSWKAPHPESHQDVAQGTPGPYRHNSPFKSQGSGTPSLCCLHPCTCGENTVHSQENKTDSGFFWKERRVSPNGQEETFQVDTGTDINTLYLGLHSNTDIKSTI